MTIRNLILLVTFSIILQSCVSTRHIENQNIPEENRINFTEGHYANLPEGERSYYNRTLLENLSNHFVRRDSLDTAWVNYDIYLVRDNFNDKVLQMRVLDNDQFVDQREIHGKWKGDQFYVGRLIRPIGIPMIFYWYYEKKMILTFTTDQIYISKGEYKLGMIFLASGGAIDYTTAKFDLKPQ